MRTFVLTVITVGIVWGFSVWFFMFLWNAIMPLFFPDVPRLDFWLAAGITLLISFVGSLLSRSSSSK